MKYHKHGLFRQLTGEKRNIGVPTKSKAYMLNIYAKIYLSPTFKVTVFQTCLSSLSIRYVKFSFSIVAGHLFLIAKNDSGVYRDQAPVSEPFKARKACSEIARIKSYWNAQITSLCLKLHKCLH